MIFDIFTVATEAHAVMGITAGLMVVYGIVTAPNKEKEDAKTAEKIKHLSYEDQVDILER